MIAKIIKYPLTSFVRTGVYKKKRGAELSARSTS